MKEKSVTFTKGKSKFLQNQRGEDDFSMENLGVFFQIGLRVLANEELLIKALMIL